MVQKPWSYTLILMSYLIKNKTSFMMFYSIFEVYGKKKPIYQRQYPYWR